MPKHKTLLEAFQAAPKKKGEWTVWVDTNVLVDFESTISMFKNMAAGDHAIEETRKLMRDAAWLAMALDEQGAKSLTAGYEIAGHLDKNAKPGTEEGQWTHLVAHVVRDYVCPGWIVQVTMDGEVADPLIHGQDRNDKHDDYMIEDALREGRPIVTRDGAALKKAKKRGAKAMRPAEYAQQVIEYEQARSKFLRRLDHGCLMYLVAHSSAPHLAANLRVSRDAYVWIWS